MNIEHIDLIHKIPDAIIAPNVFGDRKDLSARFEEDLNEVMTRPELSVSSFPCPPEHVMDIKSRLVEHFISVASDLGTTGTAEGGVTLAQGHMDRLFDKLAQMGSESEHDILRNGAIEFYKFSKYVLGPLWASYVDSVFSRGDGNGTYLFAARDATPIYYAASGILSPVYGLNYPIDRSTLVHVDWNRWFMGQEDETDSNKRPLPFGHPYMQAFYRQMGFANGRTVKIVEPGAWGSAANALKTVMPNQKFELYFMFSHMPEYIYGFLNDRAEGIDSRIFEVINDTAEAVPKAYTRPEELVERDNIVVADLGNHIIDSAYMRVWSWAVNQGAYDAGVHFARGDRIDVGEHVRKIISLSQMSQNGIWTGVLPNNTLTWTEGEEWRKNWKWGKIPPLK